MSLKMRPLNDELIDTIVKAVNLGMPPSIAANSLGIPASTFRRWMALCVRAERAGRWCEGEG